MSAGDVRLRSGFVLLACDLSESFIRASGPGGQKVNTSSSAVQLRFRVLGGRSLPEPVARRLAAMLSGRLTREGELVIEAGEHRSRERNREAALERLDALIRKASVRPKSRVATKPSNASKRRRVETKKLRSALKKGRSRPGPSD